MLYDIYEPSPWHQSLSTWTKSLFGFTIPKFYGRGIFQNSIGLLPNKHAVHIVVGDPIECDKVESPIEAQIDEASNNL